MISTKTIIDKANTKITAGLTDQEILQLSVIDESILASKLVAATTGDLPAAVDNRGRLVYVTATGEYYFSDGVEWLSDYTTAAVIVSSTLYSWGRAEDGALGDNTVVDKSSPITVVGGVNNWAQISAGRGAIASGGLGIAGGVAYAWGAGSFGALGDGTTVRKSSPVTVVGGITNWSQVSSGNGHSLGIAGGVAYAWGAGTYGQRGDGAVGLKSSPVTVVGGLTNWTQVAAGIQHSLGIAGGIAYAWGAAANGALGNLTSVGNQSSPVTVVGGITSWSQVASGNGHSLGLVGGVAYAWGNGGGGRLGDGTTISKSSPVTVAGGITNWSSISAGGYAHSLGIANGIAYTWGDNYGGRLGDGTTDNRSSPVTLAGGITNWSQVSAGNYHNLGVTDAGVTYAWGAGSFGQLGDGTGIAKSIPVAIIGGVTNWSQVSAGRYMSIAITSTTKGFNEP